MSEETSQNITEDVDSDGGGLVNFKDGNVSSDSQEKSIEETFYSKEEDQKEEGESNKNDDPEVDKKEDNSHVDGDKEEGESGDFSLEYPDESKLSDADKERIESYVKDQGLSKEAAQELIKSQSEAIDGFYDSLQSQHESLVKDWAEQVKTDKELGGENYNRSIELAKRVAHRFGSEKFIEVLDSSGYGNHPELIRMLSRIGSAMGNDEFVRPGNQAKSERSIEEIFYGKTN